MTLSARQSFEAGFYPAQVGNYFNIVELFARFGNYPIDALKVFIDSQINTMRERHAPGIKAYVLTTQDLARTAGFEPPEPPTVPEEYFTWVNALNKGFEAHLKSNAATLDANRFGFCLGSILCEWNVLSAALMILLHDPLAQAFQIQVETNLNGISSHRKSLLALTQSQHLPEALKALANPFDQAISDLLAKPFSETDRGELAQRTKAVQTELTRLVASVADTLSLL